MTRRQAQCGTYGGYQAHRRRGQEVCGPCRTAYLQYIRDYRAAHPDAVRRQKLIATIRSRTLSRLARLHPDDYARLLREERRRADSEAST
jgi:hypothetical protein